MATINCVNTKAKSKAALKQIINYVLQAEKTDERLVSGINLMRECAYEEMILTKKQYNKTGGRQYLHMIQSFSPDENVDYATAHEIACKLAEHYEGFQVLIATHKDKEHIHSHLIINSVNINTGLKIQQSFKQLNQVMDKSDMLCKQYDLSVIEDRKFGKRINRKEYHIAMKGESWKMKLIHNIDAAIANTATKDEFIVFMGSRGYGVTWQDTRKYITYTTPDGKKCRDNKLHDSKYTKERMEYVYNSRENEEKFARAAERRGRSIYSTSCDNTNAYTMGNCDEIIIRSDNSKAGQSATGNEKNAGTAKRNSPTTHRQNRENGLSALYNNREIDDNQYETDFDKRQRNQYIQYGNIEKDAHAETNTQNSGDIAADFISALSMANNLLNNNYHRPPKKSRTYSNDMSKQAKREKAKKESRNMWEDER